MQNHINYVLTTSHLLFTHPTQINLVNSYDVLYFKQTCKVHIIHISVLLGCDSFMYSCCRPPDLARKEKDIFEKRKQEFLEHEPECGVSRHRQFSKRIIGGEKAKFSELPWQAHIRISSYQCGGVLLNHWYIATAAHCVHRAKLHKISVILGEYDTKDGEDEPLESETFKVDHIIIHPDFR